MHAADARFENWLLRETGIDAASLGVDVLRRAVRRRALVAKGDDGAPNAHACCDAAITKDVLDTYWDLLNASPDERQALIELIVVPETWFFRDPEALVALAKLACERLVREPSHMLRVLSAPCSSGEEPYSISMALIDAGIGPERFLVDAIDISVDAIAFAQRGLYGRNSFRGDKLVFRERHFTETNGYWRVNDTVRQPVHFMHANLLDASPTATEIRYDFIFCRNVLIYFNRETQDRVILLLKARLAERGVIFVGAAEAGLMMRHAIVSAYVSRGFTFESNPRGAMSSPAKENIRAASPAPQRSRTDAAARHAATVPAGPSSASARPSTPEVSDTTQRAIRSSAPGARSAGGSSAKKSQNPGGEAPPASVPAELDTARRLADAGRLDDAERLAQALVSAQGPSAEAFYLLGLIADARGRSEEASDFYRKSLYLDPAHYEALAHLAMLLDAAGDKAAARRLMLRAERAVKRSDDKREQVREGETHGSRRS